MNIIAVSQRIDVEESHHERRDALDQQWIFFLLRCECLPVLIPNNLEAAEKLFKTFSFHGVLITGGNDLSAYGGNTPERDSTETFLIEYALTKKVPLLGICRGMQIIQHFFGVKLIKVEGHAGSRHIITMNGTLSEVNSFHKYGSIEKGHSLDILAVANDGVIESIRHKQYPIQGIMWHPERFAPFRQEDLRLFRDCFAEER